MRCPHCPHPTKVIKKGFFRGKSAFFQRRQRYLCLTCGKYFSETAGTLTYRQKRLDLHQTVFAQLVSGTSQRRTAILTKTTQVTVARKLVLLSRFARKHHADYLETLSPVTCAVFDDMETFEHSKLKPVSITLAVEEGSRRIIGVKATKMPAKGKNAEKARKRYGYRKDQRRKGLAAVLSAVERVSAQKILVKSDKCPRYPRAVKTQIPRAQHMTFISRRACVVGQGEMKAGGFDPLFSLNHTCAMYRDNTKRLSRKTWCTTKRIDRLQCLLDLYTVFHNEVIERGYRRPVRKRGAASPVHPTETQHPRLGAAK